MSYGLNSIMSSSLASLSFSFLSSPLLPNFTYPLALTPMSLDSSHIHSHETFTINPRWMIFFTHPFSPPYSSHASLFLSHFVSFSLHLVDVLFLCPCMCLKKKSFSLKVNHQLDFLDRKYIYFFTFFLAVVLLLLLRICDQE